MSVLFPFLTDVTYQKLRAALQSFDEICMPDLEVLSSQTCPKLEVLKSGRIRTLLRCNRETEEDSKIPLFADPLNREFQLIVR
jgi:hypothetical protein